MTASELWSRNWLTDSTDSPTSRRSLAAVWRRTWTPEGGRPAFREIAPEAVVEGGAGDALGTSAGLPERLGGMHGGEVLADITKRSPYRRERGSGKLTAAAQTALADVAVEHGGVVEGDIAGCEVDDLRSASAGEDEREDDGEVASALDGIGDDLEELLHLGCGEAAWCAGTRLGALDGITGIGLHDIMRMRNLKKEEMQERRAPTVTGEGSRPERPMPWANEKTS